jgi:sterol desaturase/sphingolipid hydroxylase (fatty acid hydroxylase superfamily)
VNDEPRHSIGSVFGHIVAFIVLQNFAYYVVHMAMHATPYLYWMHKYHHRYNTYITPSAANAVTPAEFLLAYVIPPALIMTIVRPNRFEMDTAMSIISYCNILVHTPCLESWSAQNVPAWWVGPSVHCEHHRRIHKNFASPCLNLDYILFGTTSDIAANNGTAAAAAPSKKANKKSN